MSIRFTIDWTNPRTGDKFTTDYVYEGFGPQKGFDLIGWSHNCLRFGCENGFLASVGDIKLKNPDDYPELSDKLFQPDDGHTGSKTSYGHYLD